MLKAAQLNCQSIIFGITSIKQMPHHQLAIIIHMVVAATMLEICLTSLKLRSNSFTAYRDVRERYGWRADRSGSSCAAYRVRLS